MNITIDIRCLMQPNYSGVGEYAYNLLDNIFKADTYNSYQLFYNARQNVTAFLPQYNYSRVKFSRFKYPNKLFNLGLKLCHYPKIDSLIAPTNIFFAPNLNFFALSNQVKKIITVHDLSFDLYPDFFSLKRKLWHKIIEPRKILNSFDKIIVDSQNTKNDLITNYQIPSDKIKIIYAGIDRFLYKPINKDDLKLKQIKQKFQLPENFIFFLGTLEPRKNITGIIETFNFLKSNYAGFEDLYLVIAGEQGWKFENIFSDAENSPFTSQIIYLDYINRQDKTYLYNLAKIFVFPSFYEGFGFPALEAQACGLPVVASANSSFPEILGNSAILIKPDNIAEIARAINHVLSQPEIKQNLITDGFKNAQRFSWQTCAQQTLDYLTS